MCYVYAIECRNYWKFGIAKNPKLRLSAIQTGNPQECTLYNYASFGSVEACRLHERMIHAFLFPYRERGEWFRKGTRTNATAELLGDPLLLEIMLKELESQVDFEKAIEDRTGKSVILEWANYWNGKFNNQYIIVDSLPWRPFGRINSVQVQGREDGKIGHDPIKRISVDFKSDCEEYIYQCFVDKLD